MKDALQKEFLALRERLHKQYKAALALAIIVTPIVVIFDLKNSEEPGTIQLIILGAALVLGFHMHLQSKCSRFYKQYFVRPLIGEYFDDFSFRPERKIPQSLLERSGLFRPFSEVDSKDVIEGKYKHCHVLMMNLTLRDEEGKDWRTLSKIAFSGTLMVLTFDHRFPAMIVCNSPFSRAPKVQGRKLERVKLIAPEYESKFNTWSEDQIESRKVLQPKVMEKIVSFGEDVIFSICDDCVYIAQPNNSIDLEPNDFVTPAKSVIAREKAIRQELTLVQGVIDTFLDFLNKH